MALAHFAGTGVWLGGRRISLEADRPAKAATGMQFLFRHRQPSPAIKLEPFIFKWKQFCRSRFSSGQRRSTLRIPKGMGETIADDPGGKMPGPSGWLERAA
jgi:hypothetical protein